MRTVLAIKHRLLIYLKLKDTGCLAKDFWDINLQNKSNKCNQSIPYVVIWLFDRLFVSVYKANDRSLLSWPWYIPVALKSFCCCFCWLQGQSNPVIFVLKFLWNSFHLGLWYGFNSLLVHCVLMHIALKLISPTSVEADSSDKISWNPHFQTSWEMFLCNSSVAKGFCFQGKVQHEHFP